jgi:hypothetical protein
MQQTDETQPTPHQHIYIGLVWKQTVDRQNQPMNRLNIYERKGVRRSGALACHDKSWCTLGNYEILRLLTLARTSSITFTPARRSQTRRRKQMLSC